MQTSILDLLFNVRFNSQPLRNWDVILVKPFVDKKIDKSIVKQRNRSKPSRSTSSQTSQEINNQKWKNLKFIVTSGDSTRTTITNQIV